MSGYDYDCGMYGPDGRIYQIDYANRATESEGLGVGVRCAGGVVLCIQRRVFSALEEPGASSRVFQLGSRLYLGVVGVLADGRVLAGMLQGYVGDSLKNFSVEPSLRQLVSVCGNHVQEMTHYGQARPYGCVLFLTDGRELFQISPAGDATVVFGCAAGKRAPNARVELEKLCGEPGGQTGGQEGLDRYGHLKKTRNTGGELTKMDTARAAEEVQRIVRTVAEEDNAGDQKWFLELVVVAADDGKATRTRVEQ